MNVVIHTHCLSGGGAERAVSLLARDLFALGHQICVVTHAEETDQDYPLAAGILRVAIGANGSRYRVIRMLQRLRRLRRAVVSFDAQVVMGFMTTSSLYALAASAGLSAKVVCCERVAPEQQEISAVSRFLRQRAFPGAAAVVCQSESSAHWYRARFSPVRVEVIPNSVGLPLASTTPCIEPGSLVRADQLLVLAVGRLEAQKGFDLLIEAFAQVREQLPNAHLVILGEGSLRQVLQDAVGFHQLGDQVSLPGRAGNIMSWYQRADLFVLSSRFEGFPNALLEAMAMGVPVLATDCPYGPADIVKDRISGRLVVSGSSAALSAGLLALATHPDERKRCGERARQEMQSYKPDLIVARWHRLLLDVAA